MCNAITNPPYSTILFQSIAPSWYKTALAGPALGPNMRKPGCNGAVCYCNNGNYCNTGLRYSHCLVNVIALILICLLI